MTRAKTRTITDSDGVSCAEGITRLHGAPADGFHPAPPPIAHPQPMGLRTSGPRTALPRREGPPGVVRRTLHAPREE